VESMGAEARALYHNAHARPRIFFSLGDRPTVRLLLCSVENPLTVGTAFRTKMSIQGIHSCKCLIAALTRERTVVRVKLFMSLAVVLPREPFATSRPLALERPLFVMRTHVAFQIKAPRKRAATSRHWTHEVGILLAAPVTGASSALTGYSLFRDIEVRNRCLGGVWTKHGRTSTEGHVRQIFVPHAWAG